MKFTPASLILGQHDYRALSSLASGGTTDALSLLEEGLNRATVIPDEEIPLGVVSIHSRVRVKDLDSGQDSELTLVYPHEADPGKYMVSVLASVSRKLVPPRTTDHLHCLEPVS